MKAFSESSMIRPGERLARKTWQSKEYELIHISRYNKPEQYENIILKASPDGEILRLKDVGRVELAPPFFDISSDIDGHPATAIVLKPLPGWSAAIAIEAIEKDLEELKAAAFPPGMNFEVIPLDSRDMIYAVIETPRGSTLEYTTRQVPRAGCDRQGHRRDHLGLLAGRLPDPDGGPRLERGDLSHPFEGPVRPQADLAPDHRDARGKMPDDECPSRVSSSRPRFRSSSRPGVSPYASWTRRTRTATGGPGVGPRRSWMTC